MGREVKRVALDFDWPLEKVWEGYLNPHCAKCPTCKGSGSTAAMQRLEEIVNLLMLSGEDATRGRCHPYFHNGVALYHTEGKVCGSDMVELTTALAGRAPSVFGHDCLDRWCAAKKIIAAAGLPESWGICPDCEGDGIDLSHKEAYEAWKPTEPPSGEGWQVWETVSEGSPISPVFATPEELARHMSKTRWGADRGQSYDTWLSFITGPGWAPSCVMKEGVLMDGVSAVAGATKDKTGAEG